MIPVSCESCGHGHDYAAWLAGMRVQCKSCKSWLDIPRPAGAKPPAPAPVLTAPPPPDPPAPRAPIQSWRQSVAEEKHGPAPAPPAGVSESELVNTLNALQLRGATSENMVESLVQEGCTQAFAAQLVARFLRGVVSGPQAIHAVARQLSIDGLDGFTDNSLRHELRKGGRFVRYQYCYSLLVYSSMQPSNIQFLPANRSSLAAGLPYSLLTLVVGWWSLSGLFLTPLCVLLNTVGGEDVTAGVIKAFGWEVNESDR